MARNYNNSRGNNGGNRKKKTGCKYKQEARNGKPCITAWNYSKNRGMITIVASPYDYYEGENSEGEIWIVNMTNKTTFAKQTFNGFMKKGSRKLVVPDMGMVANPDTNYFGTFSR